jgi:hypothetical protein
MPVLRSTPDKTARIARTVRFRQREKWSGDFRQTERSVHAKCLGGSFVVNYRFFYCFQRYSSLADFSNFLTESAAAEHASLNPPGRFNYFQPPNCQSRYFQAISEALTHVTNLKLIFLPDFLPPLVLLFAMRATLRFGFGVRPGFNFQYNLDFLIFSQVMGGGSDMRGK